MIDAATKSSCMTINYSTITLNNSKGGDSAMNKVIVMFILFLVWAISLIVLTLYIVYMM